MAGKVIITCALTGSGHTPSMSPYLPYTVSDVADQGVAAAEAGAAVLHLHARNPEDGSPSADPALFAEYAKRIKERSDVIVSISTGGGTGMSVQDRLQGVLELKPELCTLNLGTMNYGSFPMIDRYKGTFTHDWEEPYLESTRAEPFVSTYADIEYMLKVVGPQTGTRFEAEAYDTSHLYTLAYYLDQGLVPAPVFVQTIFGTMGGLGQDHAGPVRRHAGGDFQLAAGLRWACVALPGRPSDRPNGGRPWSHAGVRRRPRTGGRGAQGQVRARPAQQGRAGPAGGPGVRLADLRGPGRGPGGQPGQAGPGRAEARVGPGQGAGRPGPPAGREPQGAQLEFRRGRDDPARRDRGGSAHQQPGPVRARGRVADGVFPGPADGGRVAAARAWNASRGEAGRRLPSRPADELAPGP